MAGFRVFTLGPIEFSALYDIVSKGPGGKGYTIPDLRSIGNPILDKMEATAQEHSDGGGFKVTAPVKIKLKESEYNFIMNKLIPNAFGFLAGKTGKSVEKMEDILKEAVSVAEEVKEEIKK